MDLFQGIEYALSIPALCVLVILLVPVGRKQLRAWISPKITSSARCQVPFVLWVQEQFRKPNLDWLIKASAWTVTVDFYVLILPGLYFSGLKHATMQIVSGMALVTYATCGMKDLLCSPRPVHVATAQQRKQLLVLEKNLEVEYGTPSMHTSLATFMNIFLVFVAFAGDEGTLSSIILYTASAVWATWIAATRLYLGVHTPVDLFWGAGFGLTFFFLARMGAVPHLQLLIHGGPTVGLVRLLIDIWALLNYPKPAHYTTSSLYAVTFLGAWSGFNNMYTNFIPHFSDPLTRLLQGSAIEAALARVDAGPVPLRILSGLVIVAATRSASKIVLEPVMRLLFSYMPSPVRRAVQPPINIRWLHAKNYQESDVHDYSTVPGDQSTSETTTEKSADGVSSPSVETLANSAGAGVEVENDAVAVHGPKLLFGWAVKADGYPLDADFWRRYLSYMVLTMVIVEWDRLLEVCSASVRGTADA